jgi:hypothetical protein
MPKATKWDGGRIKDEGTLGVRVQLWPVGAAGIRAGRDKEVG